MTETFTTAHGTCVALDGRGLLLRGPSGVGKSATALHLMAMGATLVSDDTVTLTRDGPRVIAGAPPAGRGLIEARGIGILHAIPSRPVPLAHVVDLGAAGARLPPPRSITILNVDLPLHCCPGGLESAGALLQLLRAGRHA